MKKKSSKNESVAVIGLGRFGKSVALELMENGVEVLAIDNNEEAVSNIADQVTLAVCADVEDTKALASVGLANVDVAVIAMASHLEASILAIMAAKELGIPMIIAKAREERHAKIIERVGANKVIIPEKETGIKLAHNIAQGNFYGFVEISQKIRILEIAVKEEWIGKTLRELDMRKKYHVNVFAMRDDEKSEVCMHINPDVKLQKDTTLWVMVDKMHMEDLLE